MTSEQRTPFNPNDHLMDLQKKQYLEVKWRLVWFRDLCPQGTIDTEEVEVDLGREVEAEVYEYNTTTRKSEKVIKHGKGYARFKATVTDGKGARATGTKSENAAAFADFIEKAETGAIGRALAGLGYGTQFTGDEFNEGERLVDSPVERGATTLTSEPVATPTQPVISFSAPIPLPISSSSQKPTSTPPVEQKKVAVVVLEFDTLEKAKAESKRLQEGLTPEESKAMRKWLKGVWPNQPDHPDKYTIEDYNAHIIPNIKKWTASILPTLPANAIQLNVYGQAQQRLNALKPLDDLVKRMFGKETNPASLKRGQMQSVLDLLTANQFALELAQKVDVKYGAAGILECLANPDKAEDAIPNSMEVLLSDLMKTNGTQLDDQFRIRYAKQLSEMGYSVVITPAA